VASAVTSVLIKKELLSKKKTFKLDKSFGVVLLKRINNRNIILFQGIIKNP
jgi:hypothetical protein